MASTNKTPHLGLCQWEASDPFLREDMNGDFARIDSAFGNLPRVKLFDVTISDPVASIQLDFTEIDLEQFGELQFFLDCAKTDKYMRMNSRTGNYYHYLYSATNGATADKMTVSNGSNTFFLTLLSYIHRSDCAFRIETMYRKDFPQLETLELFGANENKGLDAGDHISVWGVRK